MLSTLNRQFVCLVPFVTLTLTSIMSSMLYAQSIEEVVIEAETPTGQVLDDLVSVAAIDAEKLANAGIENVEDVAAYVPNLVLTQTETGTNIFIRGIGSGVNQGFDQSVGLYSDRVPLPRANMARAPFIDLASVQVLRGPQYVLDGNYSIAGSVHMLSNLSLDEFKAGVDIKHVSAQSDTTLLLTAGGPINDYFAVSAVVQAKKANGFVENVARPRDEPGKEELIGRLVLGFQPAENLSFKLKIEKGSFHVQGRSAEIIFSEAVPNLDVSFGPGELGSNLPRFTQTRNADDSRLLITESNSRVATPFITPEEYPLVVASTLYASPDLLYGISSDVHFFSNTSYLDLMAGLYNDPNGDGNNADALRLPSGFLDDNLNYKRAVDADEFSQNDLINITLNTDLWLGDHQILLTGSYIDYSFDELIDGDFTAAPMIELNQEENYTQKYFSIEYRSPRDSIIELTAGASYLTGELEFADKIDLITGYHEFPDNITSLTGDFELARFTEEYPLQGFMGRFIGLSEIESLSRYNPKRDFTQENNIAAAYFQATLHFSDVLRSTIGLRYTHSEKDAQRELGLVDEAGNFPDPNLGLVTLTLLHRAYLRVFGVQIHSDDLLDAYGPTLAGAIDAGSAKIVQGTIGSENDEPGKGNRREEKLLPSFSIEWDVTGDLSLLASVRKANKLGGFDARSNTTDDIPGGIGLPVGTWEFEDEDAISYELGAKWFLPNGMGELRATAFLSDYTNLQTSVSDARAGFNVFNAGAARTKGIELEGGLQFTDQFDMQFSLAWIDFEFTDFKDASCGLNRRADYRKVLRTGVSQGKFKAPNGTFIPIKYPDTSPEYARLYPHFNEDVRIDFGGEYYTGPFNGVAFDDLSEFEQGRVIVQSFDVTKFGTASVCDFNGRTNQFVADWQGTFTFNYETTIIGLGLLKPTLDILYNSGYFTNISQDDVVSQDAYTQLNGRLALADFDGIWEVALTGENLTNRKIVTYAQDLPIASGVMGSRTYWGLVRPPRTLGINLRYNFY